MIEPSLKLKKMRRLATGLLVVMVLVYLVARTLEGEGSAWPWIRAFAEAAMVGALADWFAVTALFRHPFGLPIPHTAIVKKEKQRIGEAVAKFVRGSFLSPDEVGRQWHRWKPADRLLTWLTDPKHTEIVLRWLVARLPQLMTKTEGKTLARLGTTGLQKGFQGLPMGKLVSIFIQGFLKSPSRRSLLAPILGRLAQGVAENREWVVDEAAKSTEPKKVKLFDTLTRATAAMMSGKAVERLSEELTVASEDESHAIYDKIEQALADAAKDLTEADPQRWHDLKERLLADPETREVMGEVLRKAGHALLEGAQALEESGTLAEWAGLLARAADNLRASGHDLETRAAEVACQLSQRYGSGVESLISQTVSSWEADQLINRLENQVGPDLQFIRINGTLIGGTVGLLLHGLGLLIWA